ncbi:hypothetical protein AAG570_004314 [Ranatra chinensis]|uniref:Probable prefoldin subunit 6 n=1 Tax=Ranatra chinensis TaxID=642074 RepID=A0ABD0Y0J0_9HEMI
MEEIQNKLQTELDKFKNVEKAWAPALLYTRRIHSAPLQKATSLHYVLHLLINGNMFPTQEFSQVGEKVRALDPGSRVDYHKALSQRQMLESQLHENTAVKEELERLKPENDVFKLIGPVLVKQELIEVKQNVAKRMEYINAELKRVNDLITTLDSKQDTHREKLGKLQHQFQQEQAKVAAKA